MRTQEGRLPVPKLDDPDMRAAPAAMERAVRRAHRDAVLHGTGVLVVENGEMVEVAPDPAFYEDDRALRRSRATRQGAKPYPSTGDEDKG